MNPTESNAAPDRPRLESWKEIGAYIQRDAKTAGRWEKEYGLPVHRLVHRGRSSVYAYPREIDAWRASRKVATEPPAPVALWKSLLAPPRSLAFGVTLALCLLMVGNGLRPQSASAQALTVRHIPRGDGDTSSSVTPDGRFMAMGEWYESDGDLVIRDLVSGESKRLQTGTCSGRQKRCAFADVPVLSPDLKYVAYTWYDDDEIGGQGQLRVILNETGATPRVLVRDADTTPWPMAWTPDGTSILVTLHKAGNWWHVAWVSPADGSVTGVKSMQLAGNGRLSRLSLSPDGKYIVYAGPVRAGAADRHVYLLASDGSLETDLTKGSGVSNDAPVWTPDGTHILYTSNESGRVDLWSIAVQQGKPAGLPEVVKRDIGQVEAIGVTRAGAYMYFYSRSDDVIRLAEAESSLRITEKFIGSNPTWSPDGRSLAFTRVRPGGPNGVDLVVRSVQPGEERVYSTQGLGPAPRPWFHDGKSILQIRRDGNSLFSYLKVDLDSGEFREAVPPSAAYRGPAFLSADDRTVYIRARDASLTGPFNDRQFDRILAFDLETHAQRRLFELGQGEQRLDFRLSADGKTFAIRSEHPESGQIRFGLVAVDGSSYRQIYAEPSTSGIADGLEWSADGKALLILKGDDYRKELTVMKLPVEGGDPVSTGWRVPSRTRAILPAKDGTRLAVGGLELANELWALENFLPATQATR